MDRSLSDLPFHFWNLLWAWGVCASVNLAMKRKEEYMGYGQRPRTFPEGLSSCLGLACVAVWEGAS